MHADPIRRRHSIRLKGYDYSSPGAYFITVVTQAHKCLFGKIVDKEMHMNDLGKIVNECWKGLPAHFQNLESEPFVIMPNHTMGVLPLMRMIVGVRCILPLQKKTIQQTGYRFNSDDHTHL